MITSSTNSKVKYVRRLQKDRRFRQREGTFVAEGERWLRDVYRSNTIPTMLFCTNAWQESSTNKVFLDRLHLLTGLSPLLVTPEIIKEMSDIETPPGILMVLPWHCKPLPHQPGMILILDNIRTPGNLGTMLRTAAAAGVDGVLLTPGCVDPTNPKVVRGGMGAQLRVAILECVWEEIDEIVQGMNVWAATVDGDQVYTQVDWRQPSAVIIGSEAHGAGTEALQRADGRVTIPMAADTESLNAAMAAAVLLFEADRQRRS